MSCLFFIRVIDLDDLFVRVRERGLFSRLHPRTRSVLVVECSLPKTWAICSFVRERQRFLEHFPCLGLVVSIAFV